MYALSIYALIWFGFNSNLNFNVDITSFYIQCARNCGRYPICTLSSQWKYFSEKVSKLLSPLALENQHFVAQHFNISNSSFRIRSLISSIRWVLIKRKQKFRHRVRLRHVYDSRMKTWYSWNYSWKNDVANNTQLKK